MKKIIKVAQVIRNNWKKSLFAASVLSYGANYGKSCYDTRQLMRSYCEEAAKFGNEPHPLHQPLRRITVILNPAANKRKSKDLYEKYCAPLLHLAGVVVNVVQTEFAGQAKDLPETLDPLTDAIVIAGGDGTLSETVTGLLRRAEGNLKALHNLPIAILPLGRNNEVAGSLFGNNEEIRALADATMAVIGGALRQLDVIKIEPIEEEGRPIYSLTRLEWGAHRDTIARRDKYWIVGPVREYFSYLFAGSPKPADWLFQYCEPCRGCSKCYKPDLTSKRWWHGFMPKTPLASHLLVPNERCNVMQEKKVTSIHLSICTDTVPGRVEHPLNQSDVVQIPQMTVNVGPEEQGMIDFIGEGWAKLEGFPPSNAEEIPSRYIRLIPGEKKENEENWFAIDNEDFEVKPIALTLVPKAVSVFVPKHHVD